jgi:secreted Zn-dependent insulinase-like peptidase
LLEPSWTADERIAALEPLGIDDLREFVPVLMARLYVMSLSHGNVLESDAIAMTEIVRDALVKETEPAELLESRVVKLAPAARHLRELDIDHDDSAITVYFQGSDRSFETRARFALMSQVLSSPFYTQLRTERQLGYIVYASYESLLEIPGISFVIQSPGTGPAELERQTLAFLSDYAQHLDSMDGDAFEAQKVGVVSTLLEEDKTLWERSSRYWYEIDRRQFSFDTTARLASAVEKIEKDDFRRFFTDTLLSDNRKTITVRSIGRAQTDAGDTAEEVREKITEARNFRAGQHYFERRRSVTDMDSD